MLWEQNSLYVFCMAACFGDGSGPALLDSMDIEKASNNELERIAGRYAFDLDKYKK